MEQKSKQIKNITIHTFPSGLRLVHRRDTSAVEYFGAAVDAGSRDDPEGLEGLAHFVEHVIFKGTTHRRSWHIINRMESCGGELNAYTTKETTVVYSVFPSGNFSRAAELIGDLLCNSVFPDQELMREREVVSDEISQYRDMPSEAVFDDFEDIIFEGSALGHNILGNSKSLRRLTSGVCRNYLHDTFTTSRTMIFYCGPTSLASVVKAVERHFATLPADGPTRRGGATPALLEPFDRMVDLGNHQANTVMGCRVPSMYDPMRWPLALLSNIVGGPGMNSLLNVELRERRGLVYAVETSTTLMTDAGLFTVFFGCDCEDLGKCRRLTHSVIGRIADHGVTERFLASAKRQYLGQLTLASDVRDSSVMSMARAALYYGSVLTHSEVTERIMALSVDDLRRCAESIVEPGLSVLTLR